MGGRCARDCWVPMDAPHTMVWYLTYNLDRPITEDETSNLRQRGIDEYLPESSDPLRNWRLAGNRDNDYFYDIEQQQKSTFTGIPSIQLQDQAVTETMGPIYDRTQEHLGSTDAMIIQVRRRLIEAALELQRDQVIPSGVETPSLYRVRPIDFVLPKDVSWMEATRRLVRV